MKLEKGIIENIQNIENVQTVEHDGNNTGRDVIVEHVRDRSEGDVGVVKLQE